MCEGRGADIRLTGRGREVGDLGDGVRDPGCVLEQPFGQHAQVQLELEVGDHRDQVGVAGALAVPVDGSLHVARPGVDGRERVGDRAAGVVVTVDPDACAGRLDHVVDHVGHPRGQHAAVGVTQGDHLGARVVRRAQHLQRVVAIVAVAVEEVLGVEEDGLPLCPEVGDRVADHREILFQRGPQGELDVPVVGLRHQRHDRGTAVAQGGDLRIVGRAQPGTAGGPEGRQLGVPQVELGDSATEELGVLRVGARPATFDVADPEPVELAGDRQLVGDGQVEPLLLGAVAQGRVVDVEGALQVQLVGHLSHLASGSLGRTTKRPLESRGLRVRGTRRAREW